MGSWGSAGIWTVRGPGCEFRVLGFPVVFLLAGDDEDALVGAGLAIAGSVQVGDIAPAGDWRRQEAEVGDVAALASARVAGFLAKDHHVFAEVALHPQQQADAGPAVFDHQLTNGAGAEY